MSARAGHAITGRRLGHVPGLDGVRAVAAIAVVLFHARIGVFANGDVGVDVFFVLSGFLITSILIPMAGPGRSIDYREFYRRRALRLLPAYFAVVVACVLLEVFSNYGGTYKGAVVSSVYVANWAIAATGMGLGTLSHTWSLSVEEQFYLVWPALMGLLLRRCGWAGRRMLLAVGALVVLAWLAVAGLALVGAPARVASNATPTRAVELLSGGMLAIFVGTPGLSGSLDRVRGLSRVSVGGAVAGVLLLGLLALSGTTPTEDSLAGWPVVSVLTCAVIYACLRGAPSLARPLGNRLMTGIGKRSYGLYLWHFPVFVVIDTRWGLDSWTARLSGIAVSTVIVMLSYRFIERPFLERKDRRPVAAPIVSAEPVARRAPAPPLVAAER
jgi:peptidoglycan/LPS O-acetylase OafA/YrhL